MSSVAINADVTVGGTLKDLKHTYPVTVSSGKFVVKYLSGQTATLTLQYDDEDHDTESGNGKDYSFWLKGAGMYRFDQSDSSNTGHRLKFSPISDGTHATGGYEWVGSINPGGGHDSYVTGVSYSGTPGSAGAYTEINVQSTPWHDFSPYNTPDLYAYCDAHSGMGFGPIRADYTTFDLQGLTNQLQNGSGSTWTSMSANLPSLSADQIFTGAQTMKGNVVMHDGTNPVLTLTPSGRIGFGSSGTTYGDVGHVLTSGGSSGAMSWAAPSSSGASLSAVQTFTETNTFTKDIILGAGKHIKTSAGAQKYHGYRADGYAQMHNSTTLKSVNYGTINDNVVNFNPPVKFWGRVEFNEKTPSTRIGQVTGETSTMMFASGASANTRLEVDDGNLVVKGTNTVTSGEGSVTVDNAVYSADYKNLAGEKIIVPSTTAFDPTKEDRTGSMASIRDYIGTLIDIVPPVFAGGRFSPSINTVPDVVVASGGSSTYTYPTMPFSTWTAFAPDTDWEFRAEFKKTATGNCQLWVQNNKPTQVRIDGVGTGEFFWVPDSWSSFLGIDFGSFSNDTDYEIRIIYDSSNFTQSGGGTTPDVSDFTVMKREYSSGAWGAWSTQTISDIPTDTLDEADTFDSSGAHVIVGGTASTKWEGYIKNVKFTSPQTAASYSASVGDTFNPFTGNGTVTCTDSPTAGPNKNTTVSISLGADNFEFRNATTSSGAVVPGDTVVPIANVFTNLNSGVWQASSTFSTAGTYYLRYKATDAAGNDTPNDADHYLTVTVSS